jgi:hypothetical protein
MEWGKGCKKESGKQQDTSSISMRAATLEDEANGIYTHVSVRRHRESLRIHVIANRRTRYINTRGRECKLYKTLYNRQRYTINELNLRGLQAGSVSIVESNVE